jgi:hypothetical protein
LDMIILSTMLNMRLKILALTEHNAVISGARFTNDKYADLDCVRFNNLVIAFYLLGDLWRLINLFWMFAAGQECFGLTEKTQ